MGSDLFDTEARATRAAIAHLFMKSERRPRDNHWRSHDDEYEFMAHESFATKISVSEITRSLWFPPGWRKRLEQRRIEHKDIDPRYYMHPQLLKERGLKPLKGKEIVKINVRGLSGGR